MKNIYCTLAIVLVVVAFQAVPVLGGEQHKASQAHASLATGWERQTVPFSFSPAPPPVYRDTKESRSAMKAAEGISSRGHAKEEHLTARKEDIPTPLSFSPAPTSRPERIMASQRIPASSSRLSAKRPERDQEFRLTGDTGSAPLGFFPARGHECAYSTC